MNKQNIQTATFILTAICTLVIPNLAKGVDHWDLPYQGEKYTEEKVELIRREVLESIPTAISQAEFLTGLPIDTSLLKIELNETPLGPAKKLLKMVTFGYRIKRFP
jgi:hypothetical protein